MPPLRGSVFTGSGNRATLANQQCQAATPVVVPVPFLGSAGILPAVARASRPRGGGGTPPQQPPGRRRYF